MKLKVLLAGLIILMISLYSCEDKTQTTQNQLKSDVDLTLSPNPLQDSAQAAAILPRLIGYTMRTTSDSIMAVPYQTVYSDTTNGNLRKFFEFHYINQYSITKKVVLKYYDILDSLDGEVMGLGTVNIGGWLIICDGAACCTWVASGGDQNGPEKANCKCPSGSGTCDSRIERAKYVSNDVTNGTTQMNNITVNQFQFTPYYVIVTP